MHFSGRQGSQQTQVGSWNLPGRCFVCFVVVSPLSFLILILCYSFQLDSDFSLLLFFCLFVLGFSYLLRCFQIHSMEVTPSEFVHGSDLAELENDRNDGLYTILSKGLPFSFHCALTFHNITFENFLISFFYIYREIIFY